MAIVATLLAAITMGATACAGHTGAAVATSTAATRAVRSPSAAGKPTTLARSTPVRLQIASIGVDSPLMALGLQADGSLQVPTGGFPAGWYTGGPTPGQLGPAIIAGHVDMKGPGVFFKLHDVLPGDQITVTRADGSKPVFRVTRVEQFGKDKFPTSLVYGNIDHAGLRLITCGGSFNSATGHYEDDLVVFADLVTVPH
jgi:sortase (surface protein transpeptidase)